MANVLISSIENASQTAKTSGKVNTGIMVKGTQLVDQWNLQEKPFSKFYYDFNHDADKFANFKAGDAVKIKSVRDPGNARFWIIESVELLSDINRSVPANAPADSPAVAAKVQPATKAAQFREPDVLVRADALRYAIDLANMLVEQGKYKKTVTSEFIVNDITNMAKQFAGFMNGVNVAPQSTAVDNVGDQLPLPEPEADPREEDGDDQIPF